MITTASFSTCAALTPPPVLDHVVSGRVRVPIGTVLPLADAAKAHQLLEDRAGTGKIILKPWA